jgi:hypothetical protein
MTMPPMRMRGRSAPARVMLLSTGGRPSSTGQPPKPTGSVPGRSKARPWTANLQADR